MSSPPTDDVLERVYQRAHEIKKRRRWWLAVPLTLALVVALAAPSILKAGGDDRSQVVTDDGTDPGPPTPPPPPGSVFYAVGIPESNREAPPILQIDAATLEVRTRYAVPQLPQTTIPADELPAGMIDEPVLVGGSSPDSLRLGSDGSTLYFRIVSGTCGGAIHAVDVNDPSSARVVIEPPPNSGVGDFAPTSDGRIVWYRCSNDFTEGAIVVTDLESGSEHTINYDPRWGTAGLTVSPDAQTIAVAIYARGILPAEVRLVPIGASSPTAVQDALPLQPSEGCGFDLPKFSGATVSCTSSRTAVRSWAKADDSSRETSLTERPGLFFS
jgi:hypothetical protein